MPASGRVTHLSLTAARQRLGAIIRDLARTDSVVILERRGTPMAALVDLDLLEDLLEISDPRMRRYLKASHRQYLAGRARPVRDLLTDLGHDPTSSITSKIISTR